MDWEIFLAYINKTEKNKTKYKPFKYFNMLSLKVRISFIALFLLILAFSIISLKQVPLFIQYIVMGIIIVPLTIISRSNDDTNWAKSSIEKFKNERKVAVDILRELDIKEKNQIKQLHNHLSTVLIDYKENIKNTQKKVTLTYQIVGIPFLLVVAKFIVENKNYDLNQKAQYCIVAFGIALIIYLSLLGFIKVMFLTDSKRYKDLQDFIILLQEILDYEFEITDNDISKI